MQICSAIRPAIGPAITSALRSAFCGSKRVRSFADTVAAWYDTGAPGRFVPTYRDWQTSGALFQDSLATTPVTALEQFVGFNTDRSRNLKLGDEIVTVPTRPGLPAGGGTRFYAVTMFAMVAGRTYEVLYNVTNYSGTGNVGLAGASPAGVVQMNHTANGSFRCRQTPTANGQLAFYTSNANTADFTGISVREVPGNHRIQPTSQSRHILTARKNLITSSEDISPWSVTGGAERTSTKVATFPTAGGILYRISSPTGSPVGAPFSVSVLLSGTGTVDLGALSGAGTVIPGVLPIVLTSTPTRYAVTLINPVSGVNQGFMLRGTTAGTAVTIDQSQFEVASVAGRYQRANTLTDYDAVGFPVFLRRDGIDDWDRSAGDLNYSGTDKITSVFAGRKLSDTNAGCISELGTNANTVDGTFCLFAPNASGSATIGAAVRGTSASNIAEAGRPAPLAFVESLVIDMAANSRVLRTDGVVRVTQSNNIGNTSFISALKFYGARNGASSFYNGEEHGEMEIGNLRTADELAYVERELAKNFSEALA